MVPESANGATADKAGGALSWPSDRTSAHNRRTRSAEGGGLTGGAARAGAGRGKGKKAKKADSEEEEDDDDDASMDEEEEEEDIDDDEVFEKPKSARKGSKTPSKTPSKGFSFPGIPPPKKYTPEEEAELPIITEPYQMFKDLVRAPGTVGSGRIGEMRASGVLFPSTKNNRKALFRPVQSRFRLSDENKKRRAIVPRALSLSQPSFPFST
eukprot:7687212-Pyramimonas_sp.AAC.1